jgi:hypothetical protein
MILPGLLHIVIVMAHGLVICSYHQHPYSKQSLLKTQALSSSTHPMTIPMTTLGAVWMQPSNEQQSFRSAGTTLKAIMRGILSVVSRQQPNPESHPQEILLVLWSHPQQ